MGKRIPFSTNGTERTGLGNGYTKIMKAKAPATKELIDETDFFKIKNVCASKHIIKTVKGKLTKWRKHL